MILSVVLIGENFVIVGLAASPPSSTVWNSRMYNDVSVAALVVAQVVLTASEDHKVSSIIDWTRLSKVNQLAAKLELLITLILRTCDVNHGHSQYWLPSS